MPDVLDIGTTGEIARMAGYDGVLQAGTTVPSNGTQGYSYGCLFLHLDGSGTADALYVNTGSKTSSTFVPFDTSAGDGSGSFDTISEFTAAAGVTVDGVLLKDFEVTTNVINERTAASGVTIDGVLVKDTGVSNANLTLNSTNEINITIGNVSLLAIDDAAISGNAAADDTNGKGVFIASQAGGDIESGTTGAAGGNVSLEAGVGTIALATSGAAGGASGCITLTTVAGAAGDGAGAAGNDGLIRLISPKPIVRTQAAPQTATIAATLSTAQILGGLLVATPTEGATAYQLPLASELDAALHSQMGAHEAVDFTIINLGADADDIITLTTHTGWTLVGAMTVPSSHSSTGVVYGSSVTFRARKTAADTFTLYRI